IKHKGTWVFIRPYRPNTAIPASLGGMMPGRRWVRAVRVQQWQGTGGVSDDCLFAFTESYAYDWPLTLPFAGVKGWQRRRVRKFHCAPEEPTDVTNPPIEDEVCAKNGGITYDYDGPNVLVERKIDSNTEPTAQPPDHVYSI